MKKKRVLLAALSLFAAGCASQEDIDLDQLNYEQGLKLQEEGEYEKALKYFAVAQDSEETAQHIEECTAAITPEEIELHGFEEGQVVSIEYNSEYNLQDLADEIASNPKNAGYTITNISAPASIMDGSTGSVITTHSGKYNAVLSVEDENGQSKDIPFYLEISEPEPVRVDAKGDVTIYEGEYGKFVITDIRYGKQYGQFGFHIDYSVENTSDSSESVSITKFIIDGYQFDCYGVISVDSGVTKDDDFLVLVKDESKVDGWKEATAVIKLSPYVEVPITITPDAVTNL